jgi:RsiW-degrading membrane proteinase PrsW (M82 family)
MADVAPGGSPDQAAQPQPAGTQPAQGSAAQSSAPPASFGPAGTNPADPPTTAFHGSGAEPMTPFAAAQAGEPASPSPVSSESAPSSFSGYPSSPAGDGWGAAPPPDALPGLPATEPAPVPGRPTGRRRWLPLVGIIAFIAACAVAMLIILGHDYGITGLVIGLVAAILPVPILVGCFLWLDRYEPEPTRYLVFCFAWGSSVATLAALGVNSGVAKLFEIVGLPDALVAVLVAPFIEESMKALGPILLLWRRRREWSGITDGIVYCGISAIGFAMVENVLYLGGHGYAAGAEQYGPATGVQNVFLIFILRIVFTGFAHPLFTSMSGIGLGISSRSADRRVRWLAPIAGLLLAMMLHGTFNLLPTLSVATGQPLIMLYGYLGFMVPLFFTVVGLAIALRGWEGRLSERILPRYVQAGWFSPPEVAALGSLGRRHSARRWARRVAGDTGVKAMRSFQSAATRLALLRDGMQRGLDRKPEDMRHAADEEGRLLAAITGYRSIFVGRDPQMPQAFWNGTNYQIAFPDGVTRTVTAPEEPVVPVPIRLPPPPIAVAPGWSGYGGGYGMPPASGGYGPGYPPGSGYGAAPGYAPAPGYATGPGYAPAPGYGVGPGYAPGSGYGAGPGYAPGSGQAVPGYGPGPGYGSAGGYGSARGGYAEAPGYGAAQPGSGVAPGYGIPTAPGTAGGSYPNLRPQVPDGSSAPPVSAPGGYSTAPGYPPALAPPGWAQPGYGQPVQDQTGAGQPNYGGPPSPVQPSYGGPPGYGQSLQDQTGTGGSSYGSSPSPVPPTYGGPPAYGQHVQDQAGASQPSYGSPANPVQPTYGGPPAYGEPASDQTGAAQPNYGSPPEPVQPSYGAQTGYPAQPLYGGQPGYGSQPAYGAQPDQAEHGDPTTQLGVPPRAAGETTEPPESGHDGGHR